MKRTSRLRSTPINASADARVVSLVVGLDGVVRIDESGTDDEGYGRHLAERLSRSLKRDESAESRELRTQTTWRSYKQMIRNSTPRYERSRPRDFGLSNCIQVSPGRKEPKRGC